MDHAFFLYSIDSLDHDDVHTILSLETFYTTASPFLEIDASFQDNGVVVLSEQDQWYILSDHPLSLSVFQPITTLPVVLQSIQYDIYESFVQRQIHRMKEELTLDAKNLSHSYLDGLFLPRLFELNEQYPDSEVIARMISETQHRINLFHHSRNIVWK